MLSLKEMREAAKKAFESKVKGPVEEVKVVGNEGSTHDPRKLVNNKKEDEEDENY